MMYSKKFPVKYKRTVYEDAHVDENGHIWFNNDIYEYVPKHSLYRHDTVIRHYHVKRTVVIDGESVLKDVPVSRVFKGSVLILKNRNLIYESSNIQFTN